jgi:hypothetical protein
VAAAVRGPDGSVIASVAIYGPHSRFSSRADLSHHLRTVRECAAAIEATLAERQHRAPSRAVRPLQSAPAEPVTPAKRVRRAPAATRAR